MMYFWRFIDLELPRQNESAREAAFSRSMSGERDSMKGKRKRYGAANQLGSQPSIRLVEHDERSVAGKGWCDHTEM
jgi:hypothetical protein